MSGAALFFYSAQKFRLSAVILGYCTLYSKCADES